MTYLNKTEQRIKWNKWYNKNKPINSQSLNKLKKNFKKIKKLYLDEKIGTSKIAKIFNTHATSIRRLLVKNKIKLRSDNEARKLLIGKDNCNWTGYKEITGTTWSRIYASALKRNIKFSITLKQIWNLWKKQKGLCALSGEQLKFSKTCSRTINDETASLDRIDSSKGYTIDNVQWIHKKLNIMKREINQKDFINWCNKITKFQETL